MTVSLRLNNSDSELIKAYAEMNGISVSELFRQSVMERIEDEFDLKAYEKAVEEYRADPVTYPLEDVIKELGLD
ncbi:MAG: DUF6290 family protein [Ruminococcus flavefaciens]|nr:DUF6290 family protein [Ruminococcus flavefaciens]MCM1229232.1 DUF6290 family protein [Ruminococcus flavefaciens]